MTENTDQPKTLKDFPAIAERVNKLIEERSDEAYAHLVAIVAHNHAVSDFKHAIIPLQVNIMERDLALQSSRGLVSKLTPKDKALLARYGLKTKGTLKTIFTLGANHRHNKAVLQEIEQGENRQIAEAGAVYNAAIKAADKKPTRDPKAQAPGA